jgi:hypothetical protein
VSVSVAAARAMQRGYRVRCRRAIIADLPLVGQLGHREQLVFDPAKVARLDLVMPADTSCRQTTGSNPAADRLRVPPDLLGGFGNRQHLADCRRGCGPHQTPHEPKPGPSGAVRSCAAGGVSLTYASVRGRSLNPAPTSQISHPHNQYRRLVSLCSWSAAGARSRANLRDTCLRVSEESTSPEAVEDARQMAEPRDPRR